MEQQKLELDEAVDVRSKSLKKSPSKVPDQELSRITEASVSEYSINENRNSNGETNNVNKQQTKKLPENDEYDFLITKNDKNNLISVYDTNILCDKCKFTNSEATAETPNSESTVATTVELEPTSPSSQDIEINSNTFKTFCYIKNKGNLNINNIYLINNGHNNCTEVTTTSLNGESCKTCCKSKPQQSLASTKEPEISPSYVDSGSPTPCSTPISPKFNIFQLDSGDELDD